MVALVYSPSTQETGRKRSGVQRAASTKQSDTILGSSHEDLPQTTNSKIETKKKQPLLNTGVGSGR